MIRGTATTVPLPVSSQPVGSNWILYTVFITRSTKTGWCGRIPKRGNVAFSLYMYIYIYRYIYTNTLYILYYIYILYI